MIRSLGACLFLLLSTTAASHAQKVYSYVGDIGPDFVLLAWGTTTGSNTIGRSSKPLGAATVKVGDQTVTADRNWIVVRNLKPDTEYTYEISLKGRKIGSNKIRTWPTESDKVCFLVIGDWGNASTGQFQIADAMWKEVQKRHQSANPVRFVLTTGDNIYGEFGFTLRFRDTGDEDSEWESKFFQPYEPMIGQIPFYPTLGNHDGNETESRQDLSTYLDNFFFSGGSPARYYRFSFGGLVDFFALDSTTSSESGPTRPAYAEDGDQHKWLKKNLSESQVKWKIPYFHHPPFNAGPRHTASARDLAHFLTLFKENGAKVVFTGHEHNFQFSERNRATEDILYVVSGAGGELRSGDVRGSMERAQIAGWAPQLNYLIVEIQDRQMTITPRSFEPVTVLDRKGGRIDMPVKVELPASALPAQR